VDPGTRGRRHHQGSGQWYLHLFDTSQPDWNWHHPDVPALFEDVIRFWLDRGVAGLRVDVAHGIVKDPGLPDLTGPQPLNGPSAYRHRPELQPLFRSWRAILDSTVNLYRSALRLLCFAREPGFVLAANLGPAPVPLPAHRDVLLASGPVPGGSLPPDTAAWLSS
jgi:hypothetical protein